MKKVIGIISIVLSVFVGLQSMIAGLGNTIVNNGEASGTAGFILAIIMLVSGILTLASRESKGVLITAIVFYILGGITGLCNIGSYADLQIWSILNLIFAGALIFKVTDKKKATIIVAVMVFIIGGASIIGNKVIKGNDNETKETIKDENNNFTEKVILDNDVCKFTVLEPVEDESMKTVGYKVLVENKTNDTISVGLQDVSVDGVMNDPMWAVDVTAKNKAYSQVEWMTNSSTNENVKSIEDIKDVKGRVYIMNADTGEELCNENVDLLTSKKDEDKKEDKKETEENKDDQSDNSNKTSKKSSSNKSNTSSKKSTNKNESNKNYDDELPPGGYYVTCPECGREIYTINGDWDCGCYDNSNVDDDNSNNYDEDDNSNNNSSDTDSQYDNTDDVE